MEKKLLLFISGLGGKPQKTWGEFEKLILADPELSNSFDVNYYSYPTNWALWSRSPKIQRLANGLKTEIAHRYSHYSSIIFVCHSLGGLVAKRYIVDQLRAKESLRIQGAVLFATPNNGTELSKITRYLPWYSWQLNQLCSDSDFIESLREDWTQLVEEDDVKLKYVLAGRDWVVSRASAVGDAGYKDIEEIIDEDHRSVVKPADSESLAFKVLKRFALGLDTVLRPEDNIKDALKRHAERQISIQKHNRKYIPNVFVDRGNLRDRVRYCAIPALFSTKIVGDIRRLNFRLVSRFLEKYPIESIDFGFPVDLQNPDGEDSVESFCAKLETWLLDKSERLESLMTCDIHSDDVQERVPDENQYTFRHRKYSHGYAYQHHSKIEDILAKLKLLKARGVIITSAAGRGKTNFLCDFVENVLNPRGIPTLFLTASELSRVAPERIWQYVATIVLANKSYEDFDYFCGDYDKIYQLDKQPLIIIIDGLSEHRQLEEFVNELTLLTQRILTKPYFKIIYTCRSEYFAARFKDLAAELELNDVVFIRDFEEHVTDTEKSILIEAYFDYFKLECEISRPAKKQLTADPLFLRVFCEAYGDPTLQSARKIQPINDIYKEIVFDDFLLRKEDDILARASGSQAKDPRRRGRLRGLLASIAEFMIKTSTFADIPIAELNLSSEQIDQLLSIIDEDILLRTDLATTKTKTTGAFDTTSEVLNFTMDEFRDFFLANYLGTVVLPQSEAEFRKLVDLIVAPESSVAEGVRRFLFRMGKSSDMEQLNSIIESKPWYDEVFLEEVFEIADAHVTQGDIDRIAFLFVENAFATRDVLVHLLNRFDSTLYPNLNTSLIPKLCYPLSDDQYGSLIAPILVCSEQSYYRAGSPSLIIDSYIDNLSDDLTNSQSVIGFSYHVAVSTVVFFLGAEDFGVFRKAHNLLCDYAIKFSSNAEELMLQCFCQMESSLLREKLLMVTRDVHGRRHSFSHKFYIDLVPLLKESDCKTAAAQEIVQSIRELATNQ